MKITDIYDQLSKVYTGVKAVDNYGKVHIKELLVDIQNLYKATIEYDHYENHL